jgi:glutaredoxin
MKRILIILVVLGFYQNWHKIDKIINPRAPLPYGQNAVTIYTTSWCGYCKKAKKLLAEEKISFVEYDIETSIDGRKKYDALGGNGIPVLDINGEILEGYNESEILDALH